MIRRPKENYQPEEEGLRSVRARGLMLVSVGGFCWQRLGSQIFGFKVLVLRIAGLPVCERCESP
jgi:hypothetical protein